MMKMMSEFVRDGKVRGITSWSITDELCCDFCDGKQASVTDMSYDSKTGFTFSGKDMDKEIEMTLEEMQLIQEHILRIRESKKTRNKSKSNAGLLFSYTYPKVWTWSKRYRR